MTATAIALSRRRTDLLTLFALIATMIGAGIANEICLRSSTAAAWPDGILCLSDPSSGAAGQVIPVASYPLAKAPGKRVTVVRVIYGPGGFTRPHYHAGTVTAYIVRGAIKSQLQGGPLETFTPGQTFFEPPGSVHMVSANASTTEESELLAIFVADEGAQLTTFLD